jgi:hypothetical protein
LIFDINHIGDQSMTTILTNRYTAILLASLITLASWNVTLTSPAAHFSPAATTAVSA